MSEETKHMDQMGNIVRTLTLVANRKGLPKYLKSMVLKSLNDAIWMLDKSIKSVTIGDNDGHNG